MYSEDSWVLYFLFEVHVVEYVCGGRFIRLYLYVVYEKMRRDLDPVKNQGRLTDDMNHKVAGKDPADETVYYRNLETGDLEFIGAEGEWIEA